MSEKEYFKQLCNAKSSRLNQITAAVNKKVTKKAAGLHGEFEEMYFDRLMAEAKNHEKKYGKWPVFEMGEIESEDPVLNIYNG